MAQDLLFKGTSGRNLRTWKCRVRLYIITFSTAVSFLSEVIRVEWLEEVENGRNKSGVRGKKKNKQTHLLFSLKWTAFFVCETELGKVGRKHFHSSSNVPLSSLLKPSLSKHCKNYECSKMHRSFSTLLMLYETTSSFFSETAVLSYYQCNKYINQWGECWGKNVRKLISHRFSWF